MGMSKVMDETMRDGAAVKAVGLSPEAVRRLWQAFIDNDQGVYWSRVWAIFVLIRWCHRHRAFI